MEGNVNSSKPTHHPWSCACKPNDPFDERKEIITFLHGLNNDEILEIAGVIYPFSPSPFSDPFFAIYKRYFQWRRYGLIWKRKEEKFSKRKRDVLCKNSHKQLHKLADALKQELTLTDVIKDLEKKGMIKAF